VLYTPPAFKIDDLTILHDHIEKTGLALLITAGVDGPLASHVPLLLDRNIGAYGTLTGHLARANTQTTQSKLDQQSLIIFQGPESYISPNWYVTKQEHGRVVPTWNYAVVHARGSLKFFEDPEMLRAAVDGLTRHHEANFPKPWTTSDAPKAFVDAQLKGIIGFKIQIESLEGKYKLSQNRSAPDQAGVIAGLKITEKPNDAKLADLMVQQSLRPSE
jgi:transcriptional regulator